MGKIQLHYILYNIFIDKRFCCFSNLFTVTKFVKTFRQITDQIIFHEPKRIDEGASDTTLHNKTKSIYSLDPGVLRKLSQNLWEPLVLWCKTLDEKGMFQRKDK